MMISGIFFSCQKEGPVGPAGATGAVGPAGDDGDKGDKGDKGVDGNMKIIAKTITIVPTGWLPSGSASFHNAAINVSEITTGVLEGGAVIAYQIEGTTYNSLPYSDVDGNLTVRTQLQIGKFIVYRDYDGSKPRPTSNQTFRLIIIPGAVSGRVQSSSRISYSIDQLRNMSYAEVCAALNIR